MKRRNNKAARGTDSTASKPVLQAKRKKLGGLGTGRNSNNDLGEKREPIFQGKVVLCI